MHKLLSYLTFRWKSGNQHGLHSPFVYQLLTKGIYEANLHEEFIANDENISKIDLIILKIVCYFQPSEVIMSELFRNKCAVVKEFLKIEKKQTYKIDLLNGNEINQLDLEGYQSNQIILIREPHFSKEIEQKWDQLVSDKKSIVSIDFYHVGLLFFRTEQQKQHFILRTTSKTKYFKWFR